MRCSGCDHLKPHGPGRLAEPVVVGENRGGIDSHRCFEMQRIESPQVWHGQQTCSSVNRPVKSGQLNPVENPSHGTLIDPSLTAMRRSSVSTRSQETSRSAVLPNLDQPPALLAA